jgi:hypothetical protein
MKDQESGGKWLNMAGVVNFMRSIDQTFPMVVLMSDNDEHADHRLPPLLPDTNAGNYSWLLIAATHLDPDNSCVHGKEDELKSMLEMSKGNFLLLKDGHFRVVDFPVDMSAYKEKVSEAVDSYCTQLFIFLNKLAKFEFSNILYKMDRDEYRKTLAKVNEGKEILGKMVNITDPFIKGKLQSQILSLINRKTIVGPRLNVKNNNVINLILSEQNDHDNGSSSSLDNIETKTLLMDTVAEMVSHSNSPNLEYILSQLREILLGTTNN